MLVDDDARVRRTLAALLRLDRAWDILGEASDTAGALELVSAARPELVLLDRWLADADALLAVPRLLALDPAPLVVILSADPEAASKAQALGLAGTLCLDKLAPPSELLAALRGLFGTAAWPPRPR